MHNTKSDVSLMNNSREKANFHDLVHSIPKKDSSPFVSLGHVLKFWSFFSHTFLGKGSYKNSKKSVVKAFNPRRLKKVTRRHKWGGGGGSIGPLPSTFDIFHPID